jgi:hypothetical protein
MNKKPRWKDKEGNLYTDQEVVTTTDGKSFQRVGSRTGFPASTNEVFPLGLKKKSK